MEFLEFSIASLRDESVKLAKRVEADGYNPDCVAYLAKGGWIIGETVAEYFNAPLIELSTRRGGDVAKSSLAPVLQKLPRFAKKLLRQIEIKRNVKSNGDAQRRNLSATNRYPAVESPKRILLVDDSSDSGASVDAALAFLEAAYPGAAVKSALINVFDEAFNMAQIDWALHRNTMLSLPSSKDNRDYFNFIGSYTVGVISHNSSKEST